MKSVAIVGVGLIGGSFGLALRKAGFRGKIIGISSGRTLRIARERKIVDVGASSLEAAAEADLIFLAQPIARIIETIPKVAAIMKPGALVTDAGSTKRAICEAGRIIPGFLGGHPMAGKEVRGADAAEAGLFKDRVWVLTSQHSSATIHAEFIGWLAKIGARVVVTTPEEHDRLMALASHLPQMVSSVLAKVSDPARKVSGPGLESMTRLSHSSYEIWRDIIMTNRDEILEALDGFLAEADLLRAALKRADDAAVGTYFRPRN